MNIRIDTQDAPLSGPFFRTADRMRVDGCVNALAQEGLSLALSSVSEALLDHYVQILLQRLRSHAPQLTVEVYFPANTESLIARFNEVLASQSVRDATRQKNEASPPQVWLVHDAQQLPDQELQLLARLIQNFPGANIRAILLMVGQAPSQESLSPFGRKLLRWDIESPSEEQIESARETARHQGQEDTLELLIRRMGKRRPAAAAWTGEVAAVQPLAPPVAAPAPVPAPASAAKVSLAPPLAGLMAKVQRWSQWRPGQAPASASAQRPAPVWPTLSTLRQRSPMLGVAAIALALSVLIMMWLQPAAFGLRSAKRIPTEAASSAPASNTADAAAATPTAAAAVNTATSVTSVSTPPPANTPPDVPDPAADAQAWVQSLPSASLLIQHGVMTTFEKAEQMKKAYSSLQEARIVAAYRPGESLAHFVVVSGPYASAGKAYERIGRKDLPNTSWVRTTASLQQQLTAPAQAKEKR